MQKKTTFFDLLYDTPGVTNLYDTLGPELIHNLRRSSRNIKGVLENELRNKFLLKEETEKLYLVVTRTNIQGQFITRKQYFTPKTLDTYFWNLNEFFDIQKQVQRDMRQKMMQGECFISYKVKTGPYSYIYAFKIHGCDEV
jgi:hypothetical protein